MLLLALSAASLCSLPASADDAKAFWQKGVAATINGKVQETSSERIRFRDYPIVVDRLKELQKHEAEALNLMQQAMQQASAQKAAQGANQFALPPNPQAAPDQGAQPTKPEQQQNQGAKGLTRDEIIKKYGAPDEPRPIKAKADAPPEMQALFEAINSGDTELAWQYSLAMARRNQATQEMVGKATDFQVLAMEAAGMRPEGGELKPGEDVNEHRLELAELIEKTRRERLAKKLDPNLPITAQVEPSEETPVGGGAPATTRQQGAPTAPQSLQAPIPVDPEGKVRLVIFFDEKSSGAKEFAQAIRPLREQFKGDSKVTILAATRWSYPVASLKWLSAELSFPFGVTSGEALARKLQITEYPTYLFIAESSKESYRVTGSRTAEELGGVIRQIKGGR